MQNPYQINILSMRNILKIEKTLAGEYLKTELWSLNLLKNIPPEYSNNQLLSPCSLHSQIPLEGYEFLSH